jgi:hypothetical protein
MRFMNDAEIEEAAARWRDHPVLGPATRTLASLQAWTDTQGDGWAYWQAPRKAAARLINLILRDGTAQYVFDDERADATTDELLAAYTQIKRFRTAHQADFEIVDPSPATALPGTDAPAAAASMPGTGAAQGGNAPAGGPDGPQQDPPQTLVLAAAPEQVELAPAGAAGRPVRGHVQGPVGQIWVTDDEGVIWAWPVSALWQAG